MIKLLLPLVGTWTGQGLATYPTIDDTEYRERLIFRTDEKESLLQYEQKTWRTATNAQSHWEFGFLRLLDDGQAIEWTNAQSGGLVEVLAGRIQSDGNGLKLALTSTYFGNDDRMVEAKREITVENDLLRYDVVMATQNTRVSAVHLKATLTREVK
jgi:hypothetical protein